MKERILTPMEEYKVITFIQKQPFDIDYILGGEEKEIIKRMDKQQGESALEAIELDGVDELLWIDNSKKDAVVELIREFMER